MPVKKYKTFEDAEKDLWVLNPDEEYYKKIWELFKFSSEILKSRNIRRGVFKYKTFEEAEKDKFKWNLTNTNTNTNTNNKKE